MERKTPLYDRHTACGGKIVPYAGYLMPVRYSDIAGEHMAVRTAAGLFDVSHMGEISLTGAGARGYLNRLLTNDFSGLKAGRVRYSPMCNQDGGVIDDLLVYCMDDERFLIVVNACNRFRDAGWMISNAGPDVVLEDVSDATAMLALQGPKSRDILSRLTDAAALPVRYYSFTDGVDVAGTRCLVSQTGYTGEHGYELYCPAADASALWDALTEAGKDCGLQPCGLGARDTLRMEAAMPLYGHEMDENVSPLEAGLGFAVKMDKPDFIGKAGIERRGQPKTVRVGLKITGRGIAREGGAVYLPGGQEPVGHVTSGTFMPYLNGPYAMAAVDAEYASPGQALEAEVRGRRLTAEVVPLPFYKKEER